MEGSGQVVRDGVGGEVVFGGAGQEDLPAVVGGVGTWERGEFLGEGLVG